MFGLNKEKGCSAATALNHKVCDLWLLNACTGYLLVRDNSYDNLKMSLHKAVDVGYPLRSSCFCSVVFVELLLPPLDGDVRSKAVVYAVPSCHYVDRQFHHHHHKQVQQEALPQEAVQRMPRLLRSGWIS